VRGGARRTSGIERVRKRPRAPVSGLSAVCVVPV